MLIFTDFVGTDSSCPLMLMKRYPVYGIEFDMHQDFKILWNEPGEENGIKIEVHICLIPANTHIPTANFSTGYNSGWGSWKHPQIRLANPLVQNPWSHYESQDNNDGIVGIPFIFRLRLKPLYQTPYHQLESHSWWRGKFNYFELLIDNVNI